MSYMSSFLLDFGKLNYSVFCFRLLSASGFESVCKFDDGRQHEGTLEKKTMAAVRALLGFGMKGTKNESV